MPQRFADNAPGDFYIEDGCRLSCGVMHDVANGLIAWRYFEPDGTGYASAHCYVARQPQTPIEIARIIEAMEVGDVGCLRYGGRDSEMISRIIAIGQAELCDALAPETPPPPENG